MVVILCASLVMGWIADALLEKLGFGLVGNVVLCFMGMVSGLVVWNFYVSLQVTSSLQIIAIATSLGLRMPADLRGPAQGAGLTASAKAPSTTIG